MDDSVTYDLCLSMFFCSDATDWRPCSPSVSKQAPGHCCDQGTLQFQPPHARRRLLRGEGLHWGVCEFIVFADRFFIINTYSNNSTHTVNNIIKHISHKTFHMISSREWNGAYWPMRRCPPWSWPSQADVADLQTLTKRCPGPELVVPRVGQSESPAGRPNPRWWTCWARWMPECWRG